jgi:hypothetical protein
MTEINSNRMLLKLFKCPACKKNFKNLVQFQIKISKCPNCHHEQCSEIINNESNQENKDQNKNNSQSNSNETNRRSDYILNNTHISEIRNNDMNAIIVRARIGINNNEEYSNNNLIMDIITDNIISNLLGFTESFIMINRVPSQHDENPPVEQNVIDRLKHFKMDKIYCKKKEEEDKIEFPKCTICLIEISEGMDCISMPCEHIFHDKCVTHWLKIHNTCPLCRYELSDKIFENQSGIEQQV